MKSFFKSLIGLKAMTKAFIVFVAGLLCFSLYFIWLFLSLPRLIALSDYNPPLLTELYDREGNKIGEFFKERRLLLDYQEIPEFVIHAFVSAEDGRFFSHKGLNYKAIVRAFLANLRAGKKIQGGSTITQQLARTLLLSTEKTYTRKFKEAILAIRMENSLSKQDILSIYLNQIYFGHGAYGLESASRTYFNKSARDLNLSEAALLAGLPKAPSRFSPALYPAKAKSRQIYVLNRMKKEGYISKEEMDRESSHEIQIFSRKDFNEESPYYIETVRRLLLLHLKQEELLEGGLKIEVAMSLEKQRQGQRALKKALQDWDKRQGFRAVSLHLADPEERSVWSKKRDRELRSEIGRSFFLPGFVLNLEEAEQERGEEEAALPQEFFQAFKAKFKELEQRRFSRDFWFKNRHRLEGRVFQALISKVWEDQIEVLSPWGAQTLSLKSFDWAVPIEEKPLKPVLKSAKSIFKPYDVASFRVLSLDEQKELEQEGALDIPQESKDSIPIELYQEPKAEAALLSFDLQNAEIVALVGGYDYSRSKFNRTWQSRRQAGSAFKPFVYGAALEKGFHPASLISDSPVTFSKEEAEEKQVSLKKNPQASVDADKTDSSANASLALEEDLWRPSNISQRFLGDILFRKALIRSLNVPTVKITEQVGLRWLKFYARRLGLFSPLNEDYTMALGSSSLSLYEMLKAFSVVANQGKAFFPILIRSVKDSEGRELLSDLSLDEFFEKEIAEAREFIEKEKHRFKFLSDTRWKELLAEEDPTQLIPPSNSYVLMSLLEAVVKDPEGTGGRARVLARPVGGKTGTTDGYYDSWFVGASPFISAGVWMGYDSEKSLGKGETASRTALPAWIQYMSESHSELPLVEFPVPEQVIFANIDAETGKLVSSESQKVISQAFIEGMEPQPEADTLQESALNLNEEEVEADFIREDLFH